MMKRFAIIMLKGFWMAPDYVSLARTNKNDSESIKCTCAFVHLDEKSLDSNMDGKWMACKWWIFHLMTTNSTLSKDYRILCELGRNQYFDIILKASNPKREMGKKKKQQQQIDLNCIDVLALIKHLYTFSFTLALARSLNIQCS